jgi:thiosulfate dehydrogenase [quinone] large subunit
MLQEDQTPMPLDNRDLSLAYFLLRATLGVNILLHGVARLVSGPGQFTATLIHEYQATPLPHPLVVAFASTLPWAEAFLGLFLLIGLFTRIALTLGALLILLLTFGTCLLQKWQVAGDQLIYAAVYAALLAFVSGDRFSIDALRQREPPRTSA